MSELPNQEPQLSNQEPQTGTTGPDPATFDPFARLVFEDLPADQRRIRESDVTPEKLHAEIHGTVLSYISELGRYMFRIHKHLAETTHWANESVAAVSARAEYHSAHLDALDARIEMLEDYGSGFSSEEIEVMLRAVAGAAAIVTDLAAGRDVKAPETDEAKKRVGELLSALEASAVMLTGEDEDPDDDLELGEREPEDHGSN